MVTGDAVTPSRPAGPKDQSSTGSGSGTASNEDEVMAMTIEEVAGRRRERRGSLRTYLSFDEVEEYVGELEALCRMVEVPDSVLQVPRDPDDDYRSPSPLSLEPMPKSPATSTWGRGGGLGPHARSSRDHGLAATRGYVRPPWMGHRPRSVGPCTCEERLPLPRRWTSRVCVRGVPMPGRRRPVFSRAGGRSARSRSRWAAPQRQRTRHRPRTAGRQGFA